MAEVIILPADAAATLAAERIHEVITRKPDAVLGVATGSTPEPVYRILKRLIDERKTDTSRVRVFALDEYVGLPQGHPQSYRSVITREVTKPLHLTPSLVHVPDGAPGAIESESAGAAYERAMAAVGGVDIQLLGLGTNGHIGFNEPGSSLRSTTRIKTLTPQTRRDNARFFASEHEVPTHCITQGIATILNARHLILLAFGERKAPAVVAAVEGAVSASNPGSAIQLHPHVTVLIDEAAATHLHRAAYYRDSYRSKPSWQTI